MNYDGSYTYKPETVRVKRVTRTIEKYDPQGKLISKEVITEEEDYYDKMIYASNDIGIITTDSVTITNMNDIPYTLTNGEYISDIISVAN